MTHPARRTAWAPVRSGLLVRGTIENLPGDPAEVWAPAPDPEDVARVERLLLRIPPRWAIHVRLQALQGLTSIEAARETGVSQPTAWETRRAATWWMRWAALHLPDLVPSEVEAVLVDAGEHPDVVHAASAYWRDWVLRAGPRHSWERYALFGNVGARSKDEPLPPGLIARLRDRTGSLGDVSQGLLAIAHRPRGVKQGRIGR